MFGNIKTYAKKMFGNTKIASKRMFGNTKIELKFKFQINYCRGEREEARGKKQENTFEYKESVARHSS
ncbi:MAG: hypothetical protein IJ604_04170 [Prevotella sp.]|nr:hypothetical protein [Prevotella sp.]